MFVYIYHVCVGTSRGQKRAWDPLELQEFVNFTVRVLETKLETSGVVESTSELSFQPFVLFILREKAVNNLLVTVFFCLFCFGFFGCLQYWRLKLGSSIYEAGALSLGYYILPGSY